MKIEDENTDGYYVVQWTSGPYTLQEDKVTKDYTLLVTAYTGEVVCDVVFLNLVTNEKYLLTRTSKGNGDTTVRLKQVLLPNTTIMKIYMNNKLPKRCNEKWAESWELWELKIMT